MNLLCNRPNEIMKTPARRKSKYYINTGSFRLHNNCGSTHPSMTASKENKLPPSLSGLKFSMNPAMMGSQEQTMMNIEQSLKQLSKCLLSFAARSVPLISKRQYNLLLVNAYCKRRALTIKHLLLQITLL